MIPKRIFYVWFGSDKPQSVLDCITNWKEKLPDFELIEINEHSPYLNFEYEYNNCKWLKTVYDKKMWAFAADYVRVKVLYEYGGVYLDTDITIEKDLTPLLNDNFFIGKEDSEFINMAVFGTIKNHPCLKDMINFYQNEIFKSSLFTIPEIFTDIYSKGKYNDIRVYEREYFYPFSPAEEFSPSCITPETYCIHWWAKSWTSMENSFFLKNKHLYSVDYINEFWSKNKAAIERQERVKHLLGKKLNEKKALNDNKNNINKNK